MSIEIENVIIPSPEQWMCAILGARNAMNSWNKSDSGYCENINVQFDNVCNEPTTWAMGSNDHTLLMRLVKAGTDHRKFMRMITVYANINAPLYWWKEADTYRVGVEKNSCSTMHKVHAKEFTMEDFSCEHLTSRSKVRLEDTIDDLNYYRNLYLNGGNDFFSDSDDVDYKPKDKHIWWQMIQLLPSSYNQRRTIMLNYEVLANMYKSRKNHKLDEWVEFCKWIETLPYSELITGDFDV